MNDIYIHTSVKMFGVRKKKSEKELILLFSKDAL